MALNHTAVVSHGGHLYVLGGYTGLPFSLGIGTGGIADASDAFLRFDPAANAWTPMPPAPSKRAATAAAVIGDKLYVAAGADAFQPLKRFEIFDFATGTWSTGPDVPLATEHTAGVEAGGDFYVVGGRPLYGQANHAFVQRYSPSSGKWDRVADTRRGHAGLGAVSVCDTIVAFGGEDPQSGLPGVIKEVERYEPSTDTWTPLPDMLTPRHGLAAGAVGNTVYALDGGPITFATVSNTAEALEVPCPPSSTATASGGKPDSGARLRVKPRRPALGVRTRFRVRVRSADEECRAGAQIAFAGKRRRTDAGGQAVFFARLDRPKRFSARLSEPGCAAKPGRVRPRRAPRR
jgi:N-acetylneuraminic acid mutarotase